MAVRKDIMQDLLRFRTVWHNCMPIQYYWRMQFKPPLTQNILREIQTRNLDSADVRTLLWEIKRLRAMALYVDQLQRMVGTLPGQQGDVLEVLRRMLADEPCVKEFPRLPPSA